jgi:hypothetical protein
MDSWAGSQGLAVSRCLNQLSCEGSDVSCSESVSRSSKQMRMPSGSGRPITWLELGSGCKNGQVLD